MRVPRFTDLHRYPQGYTPASATNIEATFRRARTEQKAKAEQEARNKAERQDKVCRMGRK